MDKLDKLIELIADSDNEQLQTAFLEWQQEGIERKQKLIDKLDKIASEGNNPDSENGKLPIPHVSGSLPDYVLCMNKAFELAYKIEEVEEIGGDILYIYENDIANLIDYCRGKRQ